MSMARHGAGMSPQPPGDDEGADFADRASFWPHYLRQHRHPADRGLHALGLLGALSWVAAAAWLDRPWLLLAAPATGYGLAWTGHLAVEGNRPATFGHPVWSFLADWKMLGLLLTGRLGRELGRHGL